MRRPVWIYRFEDGTKMELLIGLTTEKLKELMKVHGAVVIDFKVI